MDTNKEKSEFELIIDLLKNWARHWYYFVIGVVLCGVVGGVYYKLKTPEYAVLSTVALRSEDNSGSFSGFSLMKSLGFGKSAPGNNVEDEAIIMSSHGPVKKMVKELELNKSYTLSKFMGIKKISLYNQTPVAINYAENFTDTLTAVIFAEVSVKNEKATIKVKINKDKIGKFKFDKLPATVTTPYGALTFEKTAYFNNYGQSFKLSMVVMGDDLQSEIYSSKLNVEEERKSSDLIHMKIVDDNVLRAKDILSTVIRVHNIDHAKEKSLLGERTLEYIDNRIAEVGTELTQSDIEIQEFKQKYGLTDFEADAKGYMDLVGGLMPFLIESQSQLEIVKLTDKYLSDPANQYSQIPYIISANGGEELMKAITSYNEELSKRNEMLQSDKKRTPVSKSMDTQLAALRENLVLALKNAGKGAEIAANNLKKQEEEIKGKMKDYPVMEKTALELKRRQELKQAVYFFLQQKKEETMTSSITLNPKLRVIDEPYPLSKPVTPDLFKIMLIVIFFGGIVIPLSAISLEPYILAGRKRKKEGK